MAQVITAHFRVFFQCLNLEGVMPVVNAMFINESLAQCWKLPCLDLIHYQLYQAHRAYIAQQYCLLSVPAVSISWSIFLVLKANAAGQVHKAEFSSHPQKPGRSSCMLHVGNTPCRALLGEVLVSMGQKLSMDVLAIKQCGQCSALCLALFSVLVEV